MFIIFLFYFSLVLFFSISNLVVHNDDKLRYPSATSCHLRYR